MSPRSAPKRPPNSTDVARLAGVSRATVSYVFNGRRDGATVPTATQLRILAAAESIGYRPNRTARALKTGKTNTIALWSASFATPYYASVLGHVQSLAQADGVEIVVVSGGSADALDSTHLPADGAIVIDKRIAPTEKDRVTVPVVSMGAYFDRSVDHVGIDLHAGTLAALAHLESRGKTRVAYVAWSSFTSDLSEKDDARIHAYRETVSRRGLAPLWLPVEGNGRQGAYDALKTLLQSSRHLLPDAFLCLDDMLAVGVLASLRDAGVSVPEAVAVIGCDGIEEGAFQYPPLTTLAQPVAEASRLAWQFLRRRIAEPETPLQSVVLTPELVVRGSA
jgi:LacI family transcriptional regulator